MVGGKSEMKNKNDILNSIKLRTSQNPILSSNLEFLYGINGCEVRDIIRELRREGEPIANSKHGYYYAKEFSEIEPTISDLENRALSMLETVKKLKLNFPQKQQVQIF